MRKAFSLIELMIAIVLLSIIMVFLYKSYAELNLQRGVYVKKVDQIKHLQRIKKTIFLDITQALDKLKITSEEKTIDLVSLQSSHSLHDRIHPYIRYLVREKKLYRLESLQPLHLPLNSEDFFDADMLLEVKGFKVYESKNKPKSYLVDITLPDKQRITLKIRAFNLN
ncbi:MAG: prepilin-type N-terminal cleavage/methylation domain-containing protein [Epsilonproteobacteria bacterium]|nr:prepilin-type N-terminal cleavage/methylation domain-containing protein [Campylobacterota bacterium]